MNDYSSELKEYLSKLAKICIEIAKSQNLKIETIKTEINILNLLKDIHSIGSKESFYFFDSSLTAYEDAYDWRLNQYLEENEDNEEIDFLNEELLAFTTNYKNSHTIEFYYDNLYSDEDFNSLINTPAFDNSFIEINDWTIIINYSNLIQDFDYFKSSTRKKIDFINSLISNLLNNEDKSGKLKLINKTSQIGFIFSQLANLGYIEVPKRAGEINYNAFAREIINSFNCDVKPGSLAKYLNPSDDKHQETERNFKSQNFNIPDTNSIS
jgi:hypothetical protein